MTPNRKWSLPLLGQGLGYIEFRVKFLIGNWSYRLSTLKLADVEMTNLPAIPLQHLIYLDLSGNRLTDVPFLSAEGIPNLKHLNLSRNQVCFWIDPIFTIRPFYYMDFKIFNGKVHLPWLKKHLKFFYNSNHPVYDSDYNYIYLKVSLLISTWISTF